MTSFITSSSNRHPIIIQVRNDLFGQVVAEGELLRVWVERGPAPAPEPLEPRRRWLQDGGHRHAARMMWWRRRVSLVLEVGGFRHGVEVRAANALNSEPILLLHRHRDLQVIVFVLICQFVFSLFDVSSTKKLNIRYKIFRIAVPGA